MDKKLNRKILFDKQTQKTTEPAANSKLKLPIPKISRPERPIKPNSTIQVVKWINSHEYFKWSPMCVKIGLDKSNFKRTLESPNPYIPEKHLTEIVSIIKQYGYAE